MEQRSAMKKTRRGHRHFLRACDREDIQTMRSELASLYDPENGPLTALTEGPCKICMTPLVDAAILTAYKNRSTAYAEVIDNISKTGATFGLNDDDMRNIVESSRFASMASKSEGVSRDSAILNMNSRLEQAGFGDAGLCIPDAVSSLA